MLVNSYNNVGLEYNNIEEYTEAIKNFENAI